MKDSIAGSKSLWLKTPFANLVRYVPSGVYFSRIRVQGKLIRRSLKTNKLTVAKLRLGDLEKVERQRVEVQGAIANGNMRFGDLRHLFATLCIESGVDIPTVSRWLGHKDGGALAMKVYGHLRDQHSVAMAEKVKFGSLKQDHSGDGTGYNGPKALG
jgi:integrase